MSDGQTNELIDEFKKKIERLVSTLGPGEWTEEDRKLVLTGFRTDMEDLLDGLLPKAVIPEVRIEVKDGAYHCNWKAVTPLRGTPVGRT